MRKWLGGGRRNEAHQLLEFECMTREISLTVKNYRCFPAARPARVTLRPGLTSFIGVNNAGKSTLLKLLYELRDVLRRASSGELPGALHPNNWLAFNYVPEVTDRREIFAKLGTGDIEIRVDVGDWVRPHPNPDIAATAIDFSIREGAWRAQVWVGGEAVDFSQVAGGSVGQLYKNNNGRPAVDFTGAFDALQSLANSLFIGPFRNAVNIGAQAQYYDLQIGQAFISQWRELQTGANRAQNEATYNLTKDIQRIFGFDELAINPTPQNDTLQLFIDGQSRRLNEVGAGLAQFVVCLANAAVRNPSWILIDEPELNLHPRLQGDFLAALGRFAKEGIVYATHSLGLARSQAQQVYSVRQIRHGESEVVPFAATLRLAEFLGELGFAALREIGYDRLLLIEGPNDIQTLKVMLRWYGKEHSTVLLPLGGSQSIRDISPAELAEVLHITDRVSALIDSEKSAEDAPLDPARAAFVAACQAAKIPCTVLTRRAIENYLSDAAIKKVKGEKYRALRPYEKLSHLDLAWAKSENWRIAAAMSKTDVAATDLGRFLDTL